jgi:hypothetical protein
MPRLTMALNISGRGYNIRRYSAEPTRYEGRVGHDGDPERSVEPSTYKVHDRIGKMKVEGDLRIFTQEVRKDRCDPT